MARWAVAACCAAALFAGFVAGRATGPDGSAVTVPTTVAKVVVIHGAHIGSARDARTTGRLDLVRVAAVRRGALLTTTIVAARGWRDSLLRGKRVRLTIDYDVDANGTTDRRDVVFLFHGRLTSWISTHNQGIQAADVTRTSATTIAVARDARVFYSATGEAALVATSPIGIVVTARWPGGRDRVPDRGWIVVPPPS